MSKKARYAVLFRVAEKWDKEKRRWAKLPPEPVGTVRIMAECEGYAMVRHKGAMPQVVKCSDLSEL